MARQPLTTPLLAAGAAGVIAAGAFLALPHGGHRAMHGAPPAAPRPTPTLSSARADGAVQADVVRLQQRLRVVPRDDSSWATLGLDYVQLARTTVDPSYYPKAEQALRRSLALSAHDNFVAMAGESSLAAARHEFAAALRWARRGLAIDPSSAVLHGALCDALTQLGRYREAEQAAVRMESLSPGTPAEARLSYAAELRGDIAGARTLMQAALSHAADATDVGFTRYYLGELALNDGDARGAMAQYDAGLVADPSSAALLEGRAKARAALGDVSGALGDYRVLVARVPQPSYVMQFAELLQATGDRAGAAEQLALFRDEQRLFAANGVALDTDEILFEADHGDPRIAVRVAESAIARRPFIETYDAYAWALHRVGRDAEALQLSTRALAQGTRSALFRYHRAAIELSLGLHAAARADFTLALRINPWFSALDASPARAALASLGASR